MKKSIWILLALLELNASACIKRLHKASTQQHTLSMQNRIDNLKRYYLQSTINTRDIEARSFFFDNFPNSFSQLDSIYGYVNDKPAPLYFGYHNHIANLFNKLDEVIDVEKYYSKLINIAINGHWEADAISDFQRGLREKIINNPELAFSLLEFKNDSEIESFWIFFFDGPHPKKMIPEQLQYFSEKDKRIYSLLEKALDKVCKSWEKE